MSKPSYPLWRRRTYLLSTFQSKFALSFALLSCFVVLLTVFLLYRLIKGAAGRASVLDVILAGSDSSWLAGALLILLSGFLGLFSIVILMMHRVAGPIHVMTRHMTELASGRFPKMRPLRAGDELGHFFDLLKQLADGLRENATQEAVALQSTLEVIRHSPAGPGKDAAVDSLQSILARKLAFSGEVRAEGVDHAHEASAGRSPKLASVRVPNEALAIKVAKD